MAENSRDRGGVHVTNTGGNVTIGDNNTVTSTVNGTQPARDARQEELLQAIRRLRADLEGVVPTEQTTALDAELSDAEDEIEGTGRAGTGRLTALRRALRDAGAVTGILASGVAVGQAVGALLGG
ncbi:hypothetical protein ABZ926_29060 [Streptomyces litmocidini]|uniref:DUF3618 domain-containing protein n=1 Tax=Streptomyces litmocidini TaxID=67318 RepID=A0ABW7UAT1_9ACTN|nr:hypothetical protein [Streptomyces sp. PanSC19]ROQ33915.1 hypothetical protein EDD98_2947 [Streptomyces sp. PanSC19]